MHVRVRAAVTALLAVLALGPWHAAAACSISSARGVRWRGESHLIALPTGRMVSAARGLPSALRLERVGGPDSLRVLAALAHSGGEAVLVEWVLTGSCVTAMSESRKPWLPPGERVFLAGVLRDPVGWVGGRPTFDRPATGFPYWKHLPGWGEESRAEPRPSVEEYWRLYEALPAHQELERDSADALAPLRAWARSHPELSEYPLVRRELELAAWYAESLARPSRSNRH